MKGRKPTPTVRRLLEGNPGKRRINRNEPQPAAPEADAFDHPPCELDGHAVAIAEWTRLAPILRRARQITDADRSSLIAACLEWDRYLAALAKVQTLGLVVNAPSGYPMTNPYLSIATRALAGCNRLWPELGLTPSSRSRLSTTTAAPGGDAFSEFDDVPPLALDPM